MKEILILKGLPGSGKSTFANSLLQKDLTKWKRVNKDLIRKMLDNSVYSSINEEFVESIMYYIIRVALLKGYNVIHDNTNFSSHVFKKVSEIASSIGDVSVKEIIFDTPIDECIKRDSLRTESVGKSVIEGMYKRYNLSKGFAKAKCEIFPAKDNVLLQTDLSNNTLQKSIIVDIDGTISIPFNRNVYDTSKSINDLPNKSIIDLIVNYYNLNYKIIFVTGRSNKFRQITEQWIKNNITNKSFDYSLYMRDDNDTRSDFFFKKEVYMNNIYNKYNVCFWIDDRPRICKMIREELGLTCLQLNHLDF